MTSSCLLGRPARWKTARAMTGRWPSLVCLNGYVNTARPTTESLYGSSCSVRHYKFSFRFRQSLTRLPVLERTFRNHIRTGRSATLSTWRLPALEFQVKTCSIAAAATSTFKSNTSGVSIFLRLVLDAVRNRLDFFGLSEKTLSCWPQFQSGFARLEKPSSPFPRHTVQTKRSLFLFSIIRFPSSSSCSPTGLFNFHVVSVFRNKRQEKELERVAWFTPVKKERGRGQQVDIYKMTSNKKTLWLINSSFFSLLSSCFRHRNVLWNLFSLRLIYSRIVSFFPIQGKKRCKHVETDTIFLLLFEQHLYVTRRHLDKNRWKSIRAFQSK